MRDFLIVEHYNNNCVITAEQCVGTASYLSIMLFICPFSTCIGPREKTRSAAPHNNIIQYHQLDAYPDTSPVQASTHTS